MGITKVKVSIEILRPDLRDAEGAAEGKVVTEVKGLIEEKDVTEVKVVIEVKISPEI